MRKMKETVNLSALDDVLDSVDENSPYEIIHAVNIYFNIDMYEEVLIYVGEIKAILGELYEELDPFIRKIGKDSFKKIEREYGKVVTDFVKDRFWDTIRYYV